MSRYGLAPTFASETQNRSYHPEVVAFGDFETEVVCEREHRKILNKDVSDNFLDFFVASHLDQSPQKLATHSLSLVLITHQNGHFRPLFSSRLAQPANREDLVLARVRCCAIRHERHLLVIVDKTFSDQPFVRNTRTQFLHMEET